MNNYFYATTMDIFVGCRTTKLFTWGLAFSRYSAKEGNTNNYQVTSWHGVRCFFERTRGAFAPTGNLLKGEKIV